MYLPVLPLPHSRSSVSPRKELIHMSDAPVFVDAAQRKSLMGLTFAGTKGL